MTTIDLGPYADRLCTAQEAARTILPGSRIFAGTACATPRALLGALEELREPPEDVTIHSFLTNGAIPRRDGRPASKYRHSCFFVGTDTREAVACGAADYVPLSLFQLPYLLENSRFPVDVALVQVSAPDRHGFVSLGISVDITLKVLAHAKRIIAEVNPQMPFTFGDSVVHLSRIERLVLNDAPVMEYTHPPADDVAEQIAAYIAGIIEDGATVHVGLGRVPNAALARLRDRRDLGFHTDVITDGVIDLIERGVVTGRRKSLHRDKVVTSYGLGTKRLYDHVCLNPTFEFRPVEYVCDPRVVAQNHRMVSVSQAFAVDLTGQACVDQLGGEFYGGVSTQPAFLRGSSRSRGGKPIICLRSTDEDGAASRLRPQLLPGEGVGVPRAEVHYVITEYGMAYLFGKSIRERALALIEIAHPRYRAELLEEAKRLGYLPGAQTLKNTHGYQIGEERRVTLGSGREVNIRPARASDAEKLRELFHAMSEEDVYTRFFQRLKSLNFSATQQLCNVNFDDEVAFLAVAGERESEEIVGSSCYFLNHATNVAEVAYMVARDWQGGGLGTALQRRMAEHARARGVRGFKAEILRTNARMIALAQRGGENVRVAWEDDLCEVTVLFQGAAPQAPPPAAG
jgi:acyl-CoA hydrolase/RimJ/RimL family protein N-acetyltransferase